jgi:nucleoid DNA-binding protein
MSMTKKELLTLATKYEIKGRHDMTKDQLQSAINAVAEEVVGQEIAEETFGELETSEAKKPVLRKGRNPSGNIPWKPKFYMFNGTNNEAQAEAFAKLPKQARNILTFMKEELSFGQQGKFIVESAIGTGYLKPTPIMPDALFAYYAKKMQAAGMFEVDKPEDE